MKFVIIRYRALPAAGRHGFWLARFRYGSFHDSIGDLGFNVVDHS